VRGNHIVGGGIASAEWVLCNGKMVLEIVSVDCINLEMALQSQRLLRRSDAVGTPGNDERGIRLAKTVEEYVSQVSGFFCPDCSSCPVSKTFVP